MPKGKRKGRSDRNRNDGSLHSSDDDSNNNDNLSLISNCSETRSEDGEESSELAQEQFEEKLCELLDGLSQKSSQGRTNCFQSLAKGLVKKYIPNFIRDRYFTMCDSIERSLKKGGGPEKAAAAELATIICVQLGGEDTSEEIYRMLKPVLFTTICDNTVSATVRAKSCVALGTITFLTGGDLGEVIILMQQLQAIFSASYLKGDGALANVAPESAILHASALSTWNLLLTLISPGSIGGMLNTKSLPSLEKLSELLESSHLEVRMAAGEALALIYELGREEDEEFEEDFALDVTETLKQLATDSHKYRAKKDRKQQRATFRDILQFVENGTIPEVQVKFGKDLGKEVLVLDTWTKRKQYESLCNILGPSINIHLTENYLLRDIFEIAGAPPTSILPPDALRKMQRYRQRFVNAANYKARTLSRAKNRDKRSDF
uniref:Interferon-related developmental regulator 1 n=1 Tax=Anoplophora glabripennis TaxID=217634 RepID=V5I981_ANOGL